jgi:hypothetical protein
MVDNSMADTVVSSFGRLDTQLSDLDAVLGLVAMAMTSPEASLHMDEATRLIYMSRRIVSKCRTLTCAEDRCCHSVE